MSETTPPGGTQPRQVRETRTLQFARFIVRNRFWVALTLIAVTGFFFYPILNAITTGLGFRLPGPTVRVDTRARDLWPDHPFIHAQDKFAGKFGTSSLVAVAMVVEDGTIFTPENLQKIWRITRGLDGADPYRFESHTEDREELRGQLEEEGTLTAAQITEELDRKYPQYPVNHDQIQSIGHSSTRVVSIESDGSITSDVLMKKQPETQADAEEIRDKVRQNPPFIFGRLVSLDEKGALLTAGFVTDRLSNRETYQSVFNHVQKIKEKEETENVKIYVSGNPILTGWVLKHAYEILMYVIATVAIIFALLWGYFRRWHGVLIPMIAAVATVIWGLGYTGWRGLIFDPLILVIPMIITARAISHTVQMAERFFEDYETYLPRIGDPTEAKIHVATIAMGELVVPGTLGIITDVAGLLMILVTTIEQMRGLGEFGAFWVTSILATVEILHPVMICYLPAPTEHEHYLPAVMIRTMRGIGNFCTDRIGKWVVGGTTVTLFVISTYIALFYSKIGEANPGSFLFYPEHEFNIATAAIAEKFGGVDSLVVYASGDRDNASADSIPIRRMEEFERWMQANTNVGAAVSLSPILRGYWRQNHYGDPKWAFIPEHPGTVRAAIFQLQTNGAPGFLRPFLTDDGRDANIGFFYPDHKGDTITLAVLAAQDYIKRNPIGEVELTLREDRGRPEDSFFSRDRLLDVWYYMLGPMLPTRHHTLRAQVRQADGSYSAMEIKDPKDGLPDWLGDFKDAAISDYESTRDSLGEGEIFTWPEGLAEWDEGDVDAWFESEEFGIRAVSVNTNQLIVHDLKAVEGVPKYQGTSSWTRGVQFVMAGGIMGILAAINDEVERSHVANITLILLVIFTLHSITYQSVPSGSIILLQISTATMLSLAYMALRGIGLNINTLPVQSVGVGIGVDYAIYIVDRIRQEVVDTEDIDEAVRRAIRTTGMAVSFTATTIVGGVAAWSFSNLRFQGEMAYLLVIIMVLNMLGAITVVPAFYSILRPKVAMALLDEEQMEHLRIQKERERKLGLRED
jgi:hypothetical protein